jgi:hypothetical protein
MMRNILRLVRFMRLSNVIRGVPQDAYIWKFPQDQNISRVVHNSYIVDRCSIRDVEQPGKYTLAKRS